MYNMLVACAWQVYLLKSNHSYQHLNHLIQKDHPDLDLFQYPYLVRVAFPKEYFHLLLYLLVLNNVVYLVWL